MYSDGLRTPAQAISEATAGGVRVLSLTDHDTVEGIDEALEAAEGTDVEFVPGTELSAHMASREVHLLAYFIDWRSESLTRFLSSMRQHRRDRSDAIVARLNDLGVGVTVDDVLHQAGEGVIGRPHVAAALVERGAVASKEEAFDRYIGDRGPAAVPKPRTPAESVIALVHELGGVAVIAHPGASFLDSEVRELVSCGLDGIEVYHPSHQPAQIQHYTNLAEHLGVLPSGGSDSHGEADGSRIGDCGIGCEAVEALRERAAGRG